MPAGGSLVIRADAGPRIGTGHAMRMLALGEEWLEHGGAVTLVSRIDIPPIEERIRGVGFRLHRLGAEPGSPADARETGTIAAGTGARWVAVDGYHFGARYRQILSELGFRILSVDDHGLAGTWSADLILDQNPSAEGRLYAGSKDGTHLLLGPRFALIRREIRDMAGVPRESPCIARNILVTMGGADPENFTRKVLQALCESGWEDTRATVVVGEANPHRRELEEMARGSPMVRLVFGGEHLAPIFSCADAAITGGGTTTLELLHLGIPFLSMILAPNQAPVAEALDHQGLTRNLGDARELEPPAIARELQRFLRDRDERQRFSEKGRALVDGQGAARVVMRMRGDPLRVRPAELGDCRVVWEWANDPVVRAGSFHPDSIPLGDHREWFNLMIHDPHTLYLIAVDALDRPVGQVRFTLGDDSSEVHYSLCRTFRGEGAGVHLLQAGIRRLISQKKVHRVYGVVRAENDPSLRTFERAGFSRKDTGKFRDHETVTFERELDVNGDV